MSVILTHPGPIEASGRVPRKRMAVKEKAVRQSVTLPAKMATQIRSMAKRRRLSANRMLVELVEEGIEAQKQKEKAFFDLAERFRAADDPKRSRAPRRGTWPIGLW